MPSKPCVFCGYVKVIPPKLEETIKKPKICTICNKEYDVKKKEHDLSNHHIAVKSLLDTIKNINYENHNDIENARNILLSSKSL